MKHSSKNSAIKEVGYIYSFFSGVGIVYGLPHVFLHEVLIDEEGRELALVVGFSEKGVEALFFEEKFDVKKPLYRSYRVFSISFSNEYIGRVVNGKGIPVKEADPVAQKTGKDFLIKGEKKSVFPKAPQIIEREKVSEPLSTEIKVIDATLPMGRGQRELIVGDRKLGKSTLAVDAVINQKYVRDSQKRVYCVYVLCGQDKKELLNLIDTLAQNDAFQHTTVVAALADSSLAQQYLAPFVGATIAEYFREQKEDALVVYDDLSQHAKAYRSISLLLERPPGREAYPGDIFSLHAELLERAAVRSQKAGGGSVSALPIIETQEEDITAFIPTNLISITDGQIYLERGLFQKHFLPAVNVGLSVSRVGSQAQQSCLKEVVEGVRLTLSQHKELQKLTRLETTLSKEAKKKLHRGDLMLELLKQDKHQAVLWSEQVVIFYAVENGFCDNMGKEQWSDFEKYLLDLLRSKYTDLLENIQKDNFDQVKEEIHQLIKDAKEEFVSE